MACAESEGVDYFEALAKTDGVLSLRVVASASIKEWPRIRTERMLARLPAILSKVRKVCAHLEGADEEDDEETDDEDDEWSFPDREYRRAARVAAQSTAVRVRTMAELKALPPDTLVPVNGRTMRAKTAYHCMRVQDGFHRLRPDHSTMTIEIHKATAQLVRHMRYNLGTPMVERGVVITMMRNNMFTLLRPAVDDIVTIHHWINLERFSGELFPGWTNATTRKWAAAFKKRFVTADAYIASTESTTPALFRIAQRAGTPCSCVMVDLIVHGIEVLLRAGIDPAAVTDDRGESIFAKIHSIYWCTIGGVNIGVFLLKLNDVYAKFPEFKLATLLNAPDNDGHSIETCAPVITGEGSSEEIHSKLLLFMCSWGFDMNRLADRSDAVWTEAQTMFAKTRASGIPDEMVLTILRTAMHVPNDITFASPTSDQIKVHSTRPSLDLGSKADTLKLMSNVIAYFCKFHWVACTVPKFTFVLTAFRCYPWWTPARHRYFSHHQRSKVVEVVLLIARRLDGAASDKCDRLPSEMWYAILSFLRDIRVHEKM